MKDKYIEIDKSITKQIMKEFKGKVIDHVCDSCLGKRLINGIKCYNCSGEGSYKIQY